MCIISTITALHYETKALKVMHQTENKLESHLNNSCQYFFSKGEIWSN